jgi:hypothetical protein
VGHDRPHQRVQPLVAYAELAKPVHDLVPVVLHDLLVIRCDFPVDWRRRLRQQRQQQHGRRKLQQEKREKRG